MARSVRIGILLLLTLGLSCARGGRVKMSSSSTEGPANTQAEQQGFEERGLGAPETKIVPRGDGARLDLAKLAEAFGPATEATPEQLARLANRPEERTVEIASLESESDDGESEPAVRADPRSDATRRIAEDRSARAQPSNESPPPPARPPPPRPEPAEKPKPTKAPAEGGADGKSSGFKAKEKKRAQKGEATGKLLAKSGELFDGRENADKDENAPTTLLPAIERRPTLGKVLVRGGDGKLVPLIARAVRVVATVQGSRARTVVDYVFENPHDRRLQGTFYHPLPADASPAGFQMFDGTRQVKSRSFFRSNRLLPGLPKGPLEDLARAAPSGRSKRSLKWGAKKDALVVEQKRAREVYEEIVRSEVDPALLEWAGGSNFEARVFPIEPRSLKRVVVAYEQPLVFDGQQYRYAYTLPDAESIVERGAAVVVDTTKGEIVASPANARRTNSRRWARFDVAAPGRGATVEVAVRPTSPNAVLRGRDSSGLPGDAFYAQVRPQLPQAADRSTGRALLLVDTSLSSEEGGAHARRAKLIQALLEKDKSIEQYAVMLFDVRPRWLHDVGWRSNTDDNRAGTYEQLRRVYLEGATSFSSVLDELERQKSWAVDGAPTTVFLLSDGEITWGLDRPEVLPSRHPIVSDVRWVTYRFGEAPANAALFDLLSRTSGGQTVTALSADDIEASALAHRRVPVSLESVVVEGAASMDVVVSGSPRLVFPGQTITVAGRLPAGGDATLVVTLASGGSSKEVRVPLKSTDDRFAPRAWAELHTRRLVALDDPRVDRMVVALSQHYRLANARASFLILENEAQVKAYDLKNEKVDLSNLERLRDSESDQRRAALLGIGLADLTPARRKFLEMIGRVADGAPRMLQPQPLLDLPYVGGRDRMTAEIAYRTQRDQQKNDVLLYERVARARALAGDTAGAVRALSTTVELRPRDTEAMRLVGYALLAVAQYDVAVELFERIRLLRPFEAQSFLEEALALDAAGRYRDAARNYEIVLARSWRRHGTQTQTTAALHYARMLTLLRTHAARESTTLERRIGELRDGEPAFEGTSAMDFQLTIHWSTDSVDIDLWVFEPSGEKCSYQNTNTASGGRLLWDVTDGLGPEVYQAPRTMAGPYDTLVHFYGSGAPKMQAPTALLMVVDQAPWAASGASSRKFLMRMLPKRDAVLMMRTDYFAGS